MEDKVLQYVAQNPGCQSADMVRVGIGTNKEVCAAVRSLKSRQQLSIRKYTNKKGIVYFGLIAQVNLDRRQ